jgi:Phage integrase, N-terminal SAM-like domain
MYGAGLIRLASGARDGASSVVVGDLGQQVGPKSWRAAANYRDYDGVTRRVERHRRTGAKAERALIEDLRDRARASGQGEINAETRLQEVCGIWFEEFKQQNKAGSTIDAYDDALRLHVLPSVGALRVRELTVGVADRFLSSCGTRPGRRRRSMPRPC